VDEAPVVPRGKALRDLAILRVLAVERVARGVVIALIAWAVWRFGSSQNAVKQLFESDLTAFKPLANHFGWDVEHASIIERVRKTFNYSPKSIHTVALLLGGYALLETVEGVGLWMMKRWGEYLTAVGTAIFTAIVSAHPFQLVANQGGQTTVHNIPQVYTNSGYSLVYVACGVVPAALTLILALALRHGRTPARGGAAEAI